jgi:hypothetical protein
MSSEEIQTLILTTLDAQGGIENTDSLRTHDGKPIPYLAVAGVLNSLFSKEVNILYLIDDSSNASTRNTTLCLAKDNSLSWLTLSLYDCTRCLFRWSPTPRSKRISTT